LNDAQAPVLVTHLDIAERLPGNQSQVVALDVDGTQIAGLPFEAPPCSATAGDLAYVIYTSGSTGQPKGVEIAHRSLLNLVYWHQHTFAVEPFDRATQLAGIGFDAAVWEVWPYLAAGASVHLPDEDTRIAPELLRDWLVAHGITITFVPTALAERLMALEWPTEAALRVLLTGADTLHQFPSPSLPFMVVNNYGPTECTVVATSGPVLPDKRPDARPSIGQPIFNTEIYILDERMQPVAVGVPGELYIGGPGVARGYRKRPELTAEKFVPNPFGAEPDARLYKTGDLARYLPDGQIDFLGRIDTQIKIRGYRLEPDEIVTLLNRHPQVQESVVIAREDAPGEKYLVAYVIPVPQSEPTSSGLQNFLGKQLPEYMVPAVFVRLSSLPLTSHGKVDRAALPAPDAENHMRDEDLRAPRNVVEERVAGILAGLLKVKCVGVDDNFFLLGGHSLLGTQVIARVRDAFGVELPLRSLFDHPTVAAISAEIERLIFTKLEGMSRDEVQRALK
jgi:amino acid adenylation domain-containing protein